MKLITLFLIVNNIIYSYESRIIEKTNNLRIQVLNSQGKDKLYAYLNLIDYMLLNQPQKVLELKDSLLVLAKSYEDNFLLSRLYLSLGKCFSYFNHLKEASNYFEKGLDLAYKSNDSANIAKIYIEMGKLKIPVGEFDIALENFTNALDISEKTKNSQLYITSLAYLGILNYILDNIEEAEKLSLQALTLAKEENYLEGKNIAYEHLAIIRIKQKRFQEALYFNDLAMEITNQLDFIINIPPIYFNYAVIYNNLGLYTKAIDYLKKAESLRKTFDDFKGIASDYLLLGRIYLKLKDFNKAISYFKQSFKLFRQYNQLRHLGTVAKELSTAYENMGNYRFALMYYKEYNNYEDSIFNQQVIRKIATINAKRQLEEKQKEILALQQLTKSQSQIQKFLILAISVIFSLLILLILFYLKVKKSQKSLAESNKKLIEFNEERDKFYSLVSHDLRSPIFGIMGFTELLKDEINNINNENASILIAKLENAIKNYINFIDNLLEWIKLHSGKLNYSPSEFSILNSVNDSLERLKSFSSQKDITTKVKSEIDYIVYADQKMVASILLNLISNAIKFSNPNSEVIVNIFKKNENYLAVQVIDSGIGISKEKLNNLFSSGLNQPSLGTASEYGSGIGLIMAKEMIEKNKGLILVKSEEGAGSIFEFTLPLANTKNSLI